MTELQKVDKYGKESSGLLQLAEIADGVLSAPNIGVDPSTFDGNLVTELTDLFSILEIIDNLVLGDVNVPQVQSDWEQTDNSQIDFIKGKPTIPEPVTLPAGVGDQTLRYNSSNELEATDILKVKTDQTGLIEMLAYLEIIPPVIALPALNIRPNACQGIYVAGPYSVPNENHMKDGIIIANADRTGLEIVSPNMTDYRPLKIWNDIDGITDDIYNVQFEVDANGKIRAWKYYKKAGSGLAKQHNNIIVDELGNFLKQLKTIGILKTDYLINSNSLGSGELMDCLTYPMQTNYYHCEFRIILKRLTGASAVNVFGNSGLQFQFTNFGENEIAILGGIVYQYQYSDGVNDQAVGGAFDNMNFGTPPYGEAPWIVNNPEIASNSTVSAEYLIVTGSFTFLQATDNDTLALLIAKTTDADDYYVKKGSFVKITLKNEG